MIRGEVLGAVLALFSVPVASEVLTDAEPREYDAECFQHRVKDRINIQAWALLSLGRSQHPAARGAFSGLTPPASVHHLTRMKRKSFVDKWERLNLRIKV